MDYENAARLPGFTICLSANVINKSISEKSNFYVGAVYPHIQYTVYQCCGAGAGARAAKSRIISVEKEPQRDASPASTAPAPNPIYVRNKLY
jgi:hypothetical protein